MSSKGEEKIQEVLRQMNIHFVKEYSFAGLVGSSGRRLRFDFAIFDEDYNLDCLLEYQGKQHYVPVDKFGGYKALLRQQQNDKAKRVFCLRNNIRLITIPYYDLEKIDMDYMRKILGR